jgi:hypothetical protein
MKHVGRQQPSPSFGCIANRPIQINVLGRNFAVPKKIKAAAFSMRINLGPRPCKKIREPRILGIRVRPQRLTHRTGSV